MRALLIGLGGAGCRIVETLNRHDERSNVKSVRSYAFDADVSLIHSLSSLDVKRRSVLSPSDPTKPAYEGGEDFDLTNLTDCFHEEGFGEIDAIFICAGLGGRMADLVPRFMEELELVFPDPVFTILTLPSRSEGVRISTRAAEQLEAIREMGSASLIFDNETWANRIETNAAAQVSLDAEGSPYQPTHLEADKLYAELNEMLARRVGLLLRAGEVTHNGVESAEVVLDAGEVLNTLTGMDIVSIGYATEKLPANISGMLKKMFVEKYMLDEGHRRTSRIIDLAKKAVYEEVSVPCDLTSAEKALVLIAGPSEELSMKGFQMVRKWIDNSIRGLEMRAGDYPVKSTKYVGVIIVLAGIQNVPRIGELEEIRDSYYQEVQKSYGFEEEEPDVPQLAVASDDSIFEPGEVLPPGDYIYALPEMLYEEESGEETEDMTEYEYQEDDDLFEDTPKEIRRPKQTFVPETPPSQPFTPETPAAPPRRRSRDPQISMGGAHRAEKQKGGEIVLPKREEKNDSVLSGMADLGERKRPKDSESAVRVGGMNRPKEVDDMRIAKVQRPKDSDGRFSAGSRQRPKDSDRAISAGSTQRPKDSDGSMRLTRVPLPKDSGGKVRLSEKKKSNEEDSHKKSEFRWL